jgi:hypothetical protein
MRSKAPTMPDNIETQADLDRARIKLEYDKLHFERSMRKLVLPAILGTLGSLTLAGITFATGLYLQDQAAQETQRQEMAAKEETKRQSQELQQQKLIENKQNALRLFFEEVVPLGAADRAVPRYVAMLSEAAGDPILRENFLAYATEQVINAGRQNKRAAMIRGQYTTVASLDPFAQFAPSGGAGSPNLVMVAGESAVVPPSDVADGLPDLIRKAPNEGYAGPDFIAYVLYPSARAGDLATLVAYVQGTGMRIPSAEDIGTQGPAVNEIRIYKAAHRKFAEILVQELKAKGLDFTINDTLTATKPRLPNGIIEFWLAAPAAEQPPEAPPAANP